MELRVFSFEYNCIDGLSNLIIILKQTLISMPIPNVATLYQKIGFGSEGGLEFARFIRLLLSAHYDSLGINFVSESDAAGDYKGIDAYTPGDVDFPQNIDGYQFKFFPNKMSSSQKNEIIISIERAINHNLFIQKFILVTPEDFTKSQQAWFESIKQRYEDDYMLESNGLIRSCKREIIHWGHSKIVELSLKFDHIGSKYFPELFPVGVGKFKLASFKLDVINSRWIQSSHHKYGYYQDFRDDRKDLTTDPVFDFHFTNSSAEIFLLERIEIHVEDIKAQLNGFSANQLLKSIGTINHEMNFSEPINFILLDDPLIFEAQRPKRFKIQLTSFVKKCPGNYAVIKFWFHFSNYSISTDLIRLSF